MKTKLYIERVRQKPGETATRKSKEDKGETKGQELFVTSYKPVLNPLHSYMIPITWPGGILTPVFQVGKLRPTEVK